MVGLKYILLVLFYVLGSAYIVHAQEKDDTETQDTAQTALDPQADEILKEMSDTLLSAKEFTFDVDITNDSVLDTGQPIQISGTMIGAVKRPNNVYAKYTGDFNTREVWYSGKKLTLFVPDKGYYGVLKTPDNIDKTMDYLIDNYDFSLPLADIVSDDPYTSVMETTDGGFVVGDSMVQGKECTHLAFTAKYVDWQIWISNDDPALPCKLVINYKEIEGVPQYQAIFSNWNLNPDLSKATFEPKLPEDAVKINFIDLKKDKEEKK